MIVPDNDLFEFPLKPLSNFKPIGPPTPEAEEWWHSFGRHLESAHRDWDKRRNAE